MTAQKYEACEFDGRIVGGYCYLLLCREETKIFIKIGRTIDPYVRYRSLRSNCALTPISFSVIPLPSNEIAKRLEPRLLKAFEKWRNKGEWFAFSATDKPEFNAILAATLRDHAPRGWPMRVNKVPIGEIEKQAAFAKYNTQKRYATSSKAFRDFCRDST